MQVMLERDQDKPLTGERIEVDDAYIGGERSGGKRGRGSAGKTPFVAAVETTAEGKPVRVKFSRVANFRRISIKGWAVRICVSPGRSTATASTPPWHRRCRLLPSADRHGSGKKAVRTPAFKWANTLLGNLKTSLTGTFHAIRDKHVPRYLAQFHTA